MLRVIRDTIGKGEIDTAIAFDNSGNSGVLINQTSFSTNFTCNGNLLIVNISCLTTVSGHTAFYGGVPLTMLVENENVTVNSHILYLVNPPQGVNLLEVTSDALIHAWVATWESYSGVDQYHPFEGTNTNQGSGGGTASVNVTTTQSNDWVILTIGTEDGSVVAGVGQTDRQNVSDSHGSGAESDKGPVSPGVQTVSYTGIAASKLWSVSATALQPTGVTIPISVSDSSVTSENLSGGGSLQLSVNDSVATSENLNELNKYYISVNDTETVTDIPLYNPDLVYVTEGVPSLVMDYNIGVSDSSSLSDVITPEPVPNPPVNDSVTIIEDILAAFGGDVNLEEGIGTAESVSLSPVPNPSTFDSVVVTENVGETVTRLFISVNDTSATSEFFLSEQIFDALAFELPHVVDFPGFYPDDTTVSEYTKPTILNPFNQIIGEDVPVFEHFTVSLIARPFANPNRQLIVQIQTKNF